VFNPVKSEDAAFRFFLWVLGVVAVLVLLVLALRAIF